MIGADVARQQQQLSLVSLLGAAVVSHSALCHLTGHTHTQNSTDAIARWPALTAACFYLFTCYHTPCLTPHCCELQHLDLPADTQPHRAERASGHVVLPAAAGQHGSGRRAARRRAAREGQCASADSTAHIRCLTLGLEEHTGGSHCLLFSLRTMYAQARDMWLV